MQHPSMLRDQLEQYNLTMDTQWPFSSLRYPIIGVLFYFLSVQYLQPSMEKVRALSAAKKAEAAKNGGKKTERKLGFMEWFMFSHNLGLCIFSLLTFIYTAPVIFNAFYENGYGAAICGNAIYNLYDSNVSSFGFWTYLFYLSKFYEFIDTWIVIARGRRPINLQVFHHCGAVLGMWLNLVLRCSAGYLFVVENSFIHTIMYFYYAMSCLGIRMKSKFIITILQIVQFVTGLGITMYQLWFHSNCMRYEDLFAATFQWCYVAILLYMFVQFYKRSYRSKKDDSKKEMKKEE